MRSSALEVFELEHRQLGFEFGTFTDRFERLDEALQIIKPMLRGDRPTVDGKWYRAESAMNEPRIRDDLPIMLGGGGERKTFALAARDAGVDGLVINLPVSGHEEGTVELAGRTLRKLVP